MSAEFVEFVFVVSDISHYSCFNNIIEGFNKAQTHARSQGGSTGSIEPPFSQVEPPQPGPKVLFLNLHACHCM